MCLLFYIWYLTDGVRVHIVKHERPSSGGDSNTQSSKPWSVKEEALKSAEPVAESGKLFVRNLWYSVTEELLQELFQKYGEPHTEWSSDWVCTSRLLILTYWQLT